MKPGTFDEIMAQIVASKKTDLKKSAKGAFAEKLTAIGRANLIVERLLSESLPEAVFRVIGLFNQAVETGIFPKYALAGGAAVQFYGAPITTEDVDLLVMFPEANGLLDPAKLYAFFQQHGAQPVGEYLVLNGLKFQMIPANDGLFAEALAQAVNTQGLWVVTLEHLIAMKLKAGRLKDRYHISHLLDSGLAPDQQKLSQLLDRYGLAARWLEAQNNR